MLSKFAKDRDGFTLIELLVVIGIIGLLAAAILVAVSPLQRLRETRNSRRSSEAYSLLNAMLNKETDDRAQYDGDAVAEVDTDTNTAQVIVRTTAGATCTSGGATTPTCPGATGQGLTLNTSALTCLAQLDDNTVNATGLVDKYLVELPIDPIGVGGDPTTSTTDLPIGANNTGYYINRTDTGRIEVGACHPELGAIVRVKR